MGGKEGDKSATPNFEFSIILYLMLFVSSCTLTAAVLQGEGSERGRRGDCDI
jgi:hypothetical protein